MGLATGPLTICGKKTKITKESFLVVPIYSFGTVLNLKKWYKQ
jgi:hypothetical protein